MFRDWLSTHPADRLLYESAKRVGIPGGDVMDYNRRKFGSHTGNLRPLVPRRRML